jgi:hypothetical protein
MAFPMKIFTKLVVLNNIMCKSLLQNFNQIGKKKTQEVETNFIPSKLKCAFFFPRKS